MKPERLALYVALLAAWLATLGSLWFSEVRYLIPCEFCWYQRILMYPMALILPIGLLSRDRRLPLYTIALSGIGMLVSTYHYLLQKTTLFSGATACTGGVSCSAIDWQAFGFVTIPFLALIAFAIIFVSSLVALTAHEPLWEESETLRDRPTWLPVASIIALSLLAFAPSFLNPPPPPPEIEPLPTIGALPDAQPIYAANCMGCHGTQGQGAPNSAPALTDSALLRDPDRFAEIVREGRPFDHPDNVSGLPMPPFPTLTADEIEALRFYLQALARQ